MAFFGIRFDLRSPAFAGTEMAERYAAALDLTAKGPFAFALFHPMLGGIPPELAWESLRLFEHDVLPKL